MIDQILSLITKAAWFLFAGYTIVSFIGTLRKHGIGVALLSMFSTKIILPLVLVMALNLLSLALVFVEPQEVGVVISIVSRQGIQDQPFQSGLHWVIPLAEQVIKYPIYWQTYTMAGKANEGQIKGNDSIRARTSDGQEVFLDCSIIFKVDPEQVVRLHIDWQDRYTEQLIRPVAQGFVRTQVSQFTVEEVNSDKRKDLETNLDRLLAAEFIDKGLILDQFLLRDMTFSPEFSASIEKKQIALEGQLEKEYEAEQLRQLAKGKADAVLIEAQAQAQALDLIAQILKDNPKLLTYEYINKLSPNIRVMLVPSETPLILPLPELEQNGVLSETLDTSQSVTPTAVPTLGEP